MNQEEIRIQIRSHDIPADQLQQRLAPFLPNDNSIRWEAKGKSRFRVADPVTIALVGAAGTALGALITGLLKIVADTEAQKIAVTDKSGNKIELPAAALDDLEKVEEVIKILKKMDSPTIHL